VLKQLYPVLLSACVVLAVAVGLRPSAAEEFWRPDQPAAPPAAAPWGSTAGSLHGQYGVVPNPPAQPMPVMHPQSWPGHAQGPHLAERDGYQYPRPLPPVADLKRCQGTLILARVGSEAILASDVLAGVDELLARSAKKLKPEELDAQRRQLFDQLTLGLEELAACRHDRRPPTQAELQRRALIRQFLKHQIDTKLICHDAKQTIPEENFPHIEKSLLKLFDEMALDKLMKRYRVETRAELDRALRLAGSSLTQEKQRFMERALAQQWAREQVKTDEEITYDEMRLYYLTHPTEFDVSAGATWEQLTVRFSTHPSKDEAYAAIAWMGNQVRRGADFAEIAKAHSDGPTASEGGVRQWPTKDLVSDQLKAVITGLPEGQLSQIIEDWRGYHIIRVVERHEAGHMSFNEARTQDLIRDKIRQKRLNEQWQLYVKKLAERTPVWTIFDDLPQTRQARNRYDPRR